MKSTVTFVLGAAAAVVLAAAPRASAQSLRLGTETGFRYSGWYSYQGGTASSAVFSEDVLLDSARCADCRLTLHAAMRLEADAGIGRDEAADYPGLDLAAARLHYAYFDWRPSPAFDLQAGRMIVFEPDTFLSFDGVSVKLLNSRKLGLFASFGMAVREKWPLGYQAPALDAGFALDDRPMTLLTSGILIEGAGWLNGRVQYRRAFDGQVQKEDVGGTLHLVPFKFLSVSAATEYSLVLQRLDYLLADTAVSLGDWRLSGGYARRNPTFAGASIFNWFNASPWDEWRAAVGWSSGAWKEVTLEYRARLMRSDTLYLGIVSPDSTRVLVGEVPGLGGYSWDNGGAITARRRLTALLDGGLQLSYDEGEGGRRSAALADLRYRARPWLALLGNAGGSWFADDSPRSYAGSAATVGAGADVRIGGDTTLSLGVDETYVTFYGWLLYATASVRAGFDIIK